VAHSAAMTMRRTTNPSDANGTTCGAVLARYSFNFFRILQSCC